MKGKELRKGRIGEDGRFLIVPMDHGVSDGPLPGLADMSAMVSLVSKEATAVLMHKGMAKDISQKSLNDCGLIVHLSAGTRLGPDANDKVLVGNVLDAVRLGADAVSIHINIGGCDGEFRMLKDMGRIAGQCTQYGMPLLAMMYARGKNVKDSLDAQCVSHVARIGAELGADIVKCNYTGSPETFKEVTKGCPVPVVIAGGPKVNSDEELLEMVAGAMEAGARGVSIGRNIFQHPSPALITEAMARIIFKNWDANEALGAMG